MRDKGREGERKRERERERREREREREWEERETGDRKGRMSVSVCVRACVQREGE